MENFLITSSYFQSWKLQDENYFLNYSAKLGFNEKKYKENFFLVEPYGNNLDLKKYNERYVNKLCSVIEEDLYKKLNFFHSENNSFKYWKIIIGNWLIRSIKIIFYRYKCLEKVLEMNNNFLTTASNIDDYNFYTDQTAGIENVSLDSEWNYNLISSIIRFSFSDKIKIINFKSINNHFIDNKIIKKETNIQNPKKFLINIFQNTFYYFNKDNEFFLKNTSLPTLEEMKLNIYLNQIPTIYNSDFISTNNFNNKIRIDLNIEKKNTKDRVEKLIRFLIPKLIPLSFLENYKSLKKISKTLKWPLNPKKIITGNSYDFDELFKIWTAQKVENGSKFLILQHGSLIGNHIFHEENNEFKVCDNFYCWGNKKTDEPKKIKMFNFKVLNRKIKKNKKIKLLAVCKNQGAENEVYDRVYEHSKIFDGLKQVVKKLPTNILSQTYFRLRIGDKYNFEKDFLENENLKIINTKKNIFEYTTRSQLVLFLYNSTGILENLTLNIPTICYWPDVHNSRNDMDKEYIDLLKKSEILFNDISLLTDHIVDKLNNTKLWWNNENLQKNRIKICEEYSTIPLKNSLKKLVKEIKI